MAKIIRNCPTCGKIQDVANEFKLGDGVIKTLKCGHVITQVGVHASDTLDITALDGKKPFEFQYKTAQFGEKSNIRFLCAHEMGLGKTIIAEMLMAAHPECRPFVVFCKSGLRMQWMRESVNWGDFMCQIIDATHEKMIPGFDCYIISLDSAWRLKVPIQDQIAKCKVRTVVIDECQLIKNHESKRTRAIRDACRDIEHVIGLSGTPIKNNAGEYFPILNILAPDKFPDRGRFLYGWCDSYFNGYGTKTGGLKNPKRFMEYTKDFIIRFERKDVLPDLPAIFRQFSFHELGDMVEEAYAQEMKKFKYFMDVESEGMAAGEKQANTLAYLSKMRHLAGYAKVDPICDFTEEFITTTDRKLMIFVHHKDVGQMLKVKLEKMAREWPSEWGKGILEITSEMDSYQRDDAVTKFKSSDYRILIGSTLASGEGLNLQFCSDCVMAERQWNPANEEQAEARFPRPGSTADKINATYFIATGTVDELFSEIVEQKRAIFAQTMKGEKLVWSESSIMQELVEAIKKFKRPK